MAKARLRSQLHRKVILSSAVAAAVSGLCTADAGAQSLQVLTQWNFDTFTSGVNNSPAPTIGAGTATPLGMTNNYSLADGSTFSVTSCDVTSSPLDPTKATGPGISNAWRIRGFGGGGGNGWSLSAPQYTQGVEFDVDTTGKSGLVFSCDWFTTNQGIHNLQEQYTIDGTTWINVNPLQSCVPNGFVYGLKIDFATLGITTVENDPTFGVRLVSAYDPNPPANGTTYSGGNGSVIYNNSSGNWRFANVTFSFTSTNTAGGDVNPILTWNPPGNTWNGSNLNWKDSNGATVNFGGTSTVASFTDAPLPTATSKATVNVAAEGVNPAGVNVSNTNGTYTFTGGPIGGGAFTKTGGGNVVLAATNSFNGLNLNGGTLHTASDANLGAATSRLTINGGTLVADAALSLGRPVLIGTNGGTLDSGAFSVTNGGTFSVGGRFVKLGSGDITFANTVTTAPGATISIQGGNVTFAGTGAASIISMPATNNTFAGNIIIAGDKGLNVDGGTLDGPGHIDIQLSGAQFKGDAATGTTLTTVNMPIHINSLNTPGDFTAAIGCSGVGDIFILTPNAVVSGSGNVIWAGGQSGGKATTFIGSQNTYTGKTIINNDAQGLTRLTVDNAFPAGSDFSFGDGSNTLSIGALDLNGHNQQLASISTNLPGGTNFISQYANGIANTAASQSTLTISGTVTTTFSAIIGTPTGVIINGGAPANNIALTLGPSNTGTLILQGLNTYLGPTTINGGTLQFDAAQATIGDHTFSSMPAGATIVNNASLVINSPNTVAGNIGGSGITTVNGTSFSYIQTLLAPTLTANSIAQGALVNNGTTTINTLGAIGGPVSGSGTLTIGTGAGTAAVSVGSFAQSSVNVLDGATLSVTPAAARVTNSATALTIAPTGLLDLANHALLLDNSATPETTVRQYLKSAYNADPGTGIGDWNGKGGITSSDAIAAHNGPNANFRVSVGYVNGAYASDPLVGPIPGHESLPTNQILVRPALYGDFNLDGKVDDLDLQIFSGLGQYNQPADRYGWFGGDLNHDGKVDDTDLQIFSGAGNYNGPSYGAKSSVAGSASAAPSLTGHVDSTGDIVLSAATSEGKLGDGVLDFVYDPQTGHMKVFYDGDTRVTAANPLQVIRFKSAGGHFLPANFNAVGFSNSTTDNSTLNGTILGAGSLPDGYDLGQILATGLGVSDLVGDLTLQWNVSGGGLSLKNGDVVVPEPSIAALLCLAGAATLASRRRRRRREPRAD